jgi:hypothetical protein
MKTLSFRTGKKAVMTLLLGAFSFVVSCSDFEKPISGTPLSGTWKLVDYVQVNNEDGRPRQPHSLKSLHGFLTLDDEGTYLGENKEEGSFANGRWSTESDNLFVTVNDGTNVVLKIREMADRKLNLIQSYPSEGGFASGIIYYSFSRN